MRKRRIEESRMGLAGQLGQAAVAATEEPIWGTSVPTPAQLRAVADALGSGELAIIAAENTLQRLRAKAEMDFTEGQKLMRQVDFITSGLYGETSTKKENFGLRPIDRARTTPPAPKAPTGLSLVDGPTSGGVTLRWKRSPGARYLAEAWDGIPEAEGSHIIAAKAETASRAMFSGLTVGSQVFCRVRIIAGKRTGPWSRILSRFVNA